MGIIGGFIHRAGIIKLGGGSSKLSFVPDTLYFLTGSELPRSVASQYRRANLLGSGGGSVGRTGDDTYYMSMMPEDGAFKHFEILNTNNTITTQVDYFLLDQKTSDILCLIEMLPSTSGSFIDSTEYTFSKDDYIIAKMDRTPNTSGGLADSNLIIGITYDD